MRLKKRWRMLSLFCLDAIMILTYKINLRDQLRSFREGLILFAITPIGILTFQFIKGEPLNDYKTIIAFAFLFNLFFSIPALYLHFTYYLENRSTLLTIDSETKSFAIIQNSDRVEFSFDEVHVAEQHIDIYYKNKIDHRSRFQSHWAGYGYLKIKLKNGQTYFLSSLMIDIQNPPLPFSQTKYRFIPFISKKQLDMAHARSFLEKQQEEKYNTYLEKFATLPREILQEKITNAKHYEPEAVEAAKKLLQNNS